MTTLTDRLLNILKSDSPVKAWRLGERLNIKVIKVWELVHRARIDSKPIGSGSDGYYYCNEPYELDHTIAQIQSRINSLMKISIALHKTRSRLSGEQTTLNL